MRANHRDYFDKKPASLQSHWDKNAGANRGKAARAPLWSDELRRKNIVSIICGRKNFTRI